jgi:hypothetical protein
MNFRHTYRHHHKRQNLYVYLNGKLVLTIKNIKKMADLTLKVTDNQDELDALKGQVNDAVTALTAAIESGQTALASLQAFQISFTAEVVPPTAPAAE